MENDLRENKNQKVDTLVDDAKDAADAGRETENQLSNNLISITLAFVALLATAISTSNVLKAIDYSQKMVIMWSIIVFCVSIFVGLINYFLNMRYHQRIAKINSKKAREAHKSDSKRELSSVKRNAVVVTKRPIVRNNALIVTQIVLLMAGLVLCVTFIGMMLFVTGNQV